MKQTYPRYIISISSMIPELAHCFLDPYNLFQTTRYHLLTSYRRRWQTTTISSTPNRTQPEIPSCIVAIATTSQYQPYITSHHSTSQSADLYKLSKQNPQHFILTTSALRRVQTIQTECGRVKEVRTSLRLEKEPALLGSNRTLDFSSLLLAKGFIKRGVIVFILIQVPTKIR